MVLGESVALLVSAVVLVGLSAARPNITWLLAVFAVSVVGSATLVYSSDVIDANHNRYVV